MKESTTNPIRVLELFAGIGACSKALENLNIPHEIVDAVEIDKYAIAAFNAIHGTNFEAQDIKEWNKDVKVDLIMHGSPCQDFSIAGRQAGGDEGSGTRSSLMYETLRIVEKLQPKYVIWENVKNILSQRHVHNWDAYAEYMEELGYTNYCQILNAKDYGIPQNRERVFTVSIKDYFDPDFNCILAKEFRFPEPIPLEKKLKDILDENVDEKYYLSYKQYLGMINTHFNSYKLSTLLKDGNGIASCIKARFEGTPQLIPIKTANKQGYDFAKDGDGIDLSYPHSTTRRGRVGHDVAKTLPTSDVQGVVDYPRIRKFTPRECYRLMGFDDESFEKAASVISNTQLYKTAGNSIVVPILEGILKNLIEL